jgi:hypothetical protein
MAKPQDQSQPKDENQSTYFVYDKQQYKDELYRLAKQDHLLTTAMGGALAEQIDVKSFHDIKDVACGSGGWVLQDQEYDAIHQQARDEVYRPDFRATWNLLTAWGNKPLSSVPRARLSI